MSANIPTGRRAYSRSPSRRPFSYDDDFSEGETLSAPPDRRRSRLRWEERQRQHHGDPEEHRREEFYRQSYRDREKYYRGDNRQQDRARGDDWDRRGRDAYRYNDGDREPSRDRDWDRRGRDSLSGRSRSRSRGRSHSRSHGRSRSRSHSRSHSHSRPKSYSPLPRGGIPTDTIIMERLPAHLGVNELRSALMESTSLSQYANVEVRMPVSKSSRRAFVQFEHVDDAADFMDTYFPKFKLRLLDSLDEAPDGQIVVYLHYARPKEDAESPQPTANGSNWDCRLCGFANYPTRRKCKSCGGTRNGAAPSRTLLTGETDVGPDPSQILVIYPLDLSVDEAVLAAEAQRLDMEDRKDPDAAGGGHPSKLKSTAPPRDGAGYGARPGSVHRVFLMRDVDTGDSCRYGFVEYWTLADAVAAATKFRICRNFAVAGVPVTVSHVHMGVFVPEMRQLAFSHERYSFSPVFNPTLRVRYWSPSAYPSEKVVFTEPPPPAAAAAAAGAAAAGGDKEADKNSNKGDKATTASSNGDGSNDPVEADVEPGGSRKLKKRKAEGMLASELAKKKAAQSTPMMAGQMAVWAKKHAEIHNASGKPKSTDGTDSAAAASSSFKISLSGATQAALSQPAAFETTATATATGEETPKVVTATAVAPTTTELTTADGDGGPREVSYLDHDRLCCLLCYMKYKSADDLAIHARSGNHKKAMQDEEKVKAAQPRLVARDNRIKASAATAAAKETGGGRSEETLEEDAERAAATQYRDRAKERRKTFKQPDKPSRSQSRSGTNSNAADAKKAGESKPEPNSVAASSAREERGSKDASPQPRLSPASPSAPPPQPQPSRASKGSAMLAKMGWVSGSGLGANSEGRTDAVETRAYREGAGLGASDAQLGDAAVVAARNTRSDFGEYIDMVQEKARERYNAIN